MFSEEFACAECGISIPALEPRDFSFNSPHGACPDCTGLGTKQEIDPDLIIPNKKLSLAEGAIKPIGAVILVDVRKEQTALLEAIASHVPVVGLVDTNSDPSGIDFVRGE